ncbi:RNA-dependent RNA-polymerase [Emaravirus cercidis]|uniref:RNA-directed RNA polymerase L n=1 Tax=Emaravirus cercidis TaxID=1980432 RepID=G3G862_9VIRU|nr:RNA-dependent RNA-polymerase [Emaravirus cercidis]AEO95760.1 RNA-dependent RNA-polymerase [Emaravirus cercidis]
MDKLKKVEYESTVHDLKEGKIFDDDIFSKFMKLVGKTISSYTITSKKKEVEAVYHQCVSSGEFMPELIDIATRMIHSPPSKNQIDFALTIVQLLESARHDELGYVVALKLQNCGYNVIATDFKIKDFFPGINSILTPDILYQDEHGNKFILELKVRNKLTDLKYYYDRYASVIKSEASVAVFNFIDDKFYEYGDYKLSTQINIIGDEFKAVTECIQLAKELRAKYSNYPQYILYSTEAQDIIQEDLISGFDEIYKELEGYEEIKGLFGEHWDDIIKNIDEYNLVDNEEAVHEDLMQTEANLQQYCVKHMADYKQHRYRNYEKVGSYNQTKLLNKNVDELIDRRNEKKYHIVENYKPSVYIPISKTIKLTSYDGSRLKFYRDAFIDIKISGDTYSRSAYNLIDSIFNTISVELLVTKDSKIDHKLYKDVLDPEFVKTIFDETPKYRKVAHISNITSDVTILANNSFSINSHTDPMMKQNICGYKNKHYDADRKGKDCLLYSKASNDINKFLMCASKVFNSEHHAGVYLNDLVTLESMSIRHKDSDIPIQARTKYLEHLYNCHVIFKNIISLNTVNSHKFRLLQTPDPNTILVLLPNADALKGNPLRYFCINILDKDCDDDIELNKLLGIYHSHTTTKKYTIMLSKVISLNVTRMKLLSNSFCKYTLLISYYSQFKKKIPINIQTMCWLLTQFVTISSLTITDVYKNIIMAIYSDYSNIDNLIEDKLECRPRTISQIYLMKLMFTGIIKASDQLDKIILSKNEAQVDDSGELTMTGFNKSLKLRLPISDISTNNPKEVIHEAFILFYLGNKGLHGSPQELLNLYHTPFQFEKEYQAMIDNYGCYTYEMGNYSNMSFSYEAMQLTAKYAYAKLLNKTREIRETLKSYLCFDDPILTIKQFSSTKSMVSNSIPKEVESDIKINHKTDLLGLERFVDGQKIDSPEEFVKEMNVRINKINTEKKAQVDQNVKNNLSKLSKGVTLLPLLELHVKGDVKFIGFTKTKYAKAVGGDFVKQTSTKVFDEFYRISDEEGISTLRSFYMNYLNKHDLLVRIFYKDQRTADDREIYTGNAQVRLCLYPIEMVFKSVCKFIPEEAITISGDQKQKRLLDQRLALLKTKKHMDRSGKKTEIYSVSSDASKWSARDLFPKFILALSVNPFLTKNEKYFVLYLMIKYYDKKIVLTDSAFLNILRFAKPGNSGPYEAMTKDYTSNNFKVRSNWLQGNLNLTSSFVHHCSTLMTEMMLSVLSEQEGFQAVVTSMVHSDDSTYDFLIATDGNSSTEYISKQDIGKTIISLLSFSNMKHCITLNEKKTYISTFYKEFLSTTIVGNELFFFYMADILPIASDTSYTSPVGDFSSYNGYINNSFSHACPIDVLKPAICLINHLTLATYNMQYTSEKNPKSLIGDSIDLPMQIYPRYKLDLSLAGSIPYYSADAFNILHDMLEMLDKANEIKSSLIESIVDEELIQRYLDVIKADFPTKYRYLQYCMLTMDYSQYERDDQDPYNIIDYDLSQKSIINVVSINKGARIKKTHTYQKYLEDEKNIKLTCATYPMWCISKPKDHSLIKLNILSNYSNPNFKDSLIYSKPAIDYGRRIINSNRSLYTLSSHLFEKEKPKNLKTIYNQLSKKSAEIILTPESVMKYLSIYLFSEKKISAALQIYYSKRTVTYMDRPEFTKVIMPKSVYSEEYGRNSINSMFEHLLVQKYCDIDDIDPKAERFIKICEYTLERLPSHIKLYYNPEDVDEQFIDYMNFKYSNNNVEECLISTNDIDSYQMTVYHNKVKFQGLMIRYYTDIKQTLENPSYNIPNYVSPNSIIMTIDSLMKRDSISTKIYLAHTKANRFDDYWLGRFGMYADNKFFVKYKLGYRIKIATDNMLAPTMTKVKSTYEAVGMLTKLLCTDQELLSELMSDEEFTIGGFTINELLSEMKMTNDINNNLLLYAFDQIQYPTFLRVLELNNRIWNYWVLPTDTNINDPDASIALYNYKSAFMRVETVGINNGVSFTITLAKSGYLPEDCVPIMLKQVCKDYASQLRRAIIMKNVKDSYNQKGFYINSYGRLARPYDKDKHCIGTIKVCNIKSIRPQYTIADGIIRQMVVVDTPLFSNEFVFKFKHHVDDDYYINNLVDNMELQPSLICTHLIEREYITNNFEYYKEISPYMGSGHYMQLFAINRGFRNYADKIDISKFARLLHISNHIKDNHPNDVIVKQSQSLKLTCLQMGLDLNKKTKPDAFINSLMKYKFDQSYYTDFLDLYSKNESTPYENLIRFIHCTNNQGPLMNKIILAVLTILKCYPSRYIDQDDDVTFD